MKQKIIMSILAVMILGLILVSCTETQVKRDDWKYSIPNEGLVDKVKAVVQSAGGLSQSRFMAAEASDIGFSVGGAKDINSFRENIKNDYLPLPTDITYEGLFYDYFFDTGESERCDKLFCPSYSYAISKDPFSNKDDYYLSVGLNSGISDFQRKKLNLVIVLDISGSMGSPFNQYYYDQFGKRVEIEDIEKEDAEKTKIEIADESVVALLDHLKDDDRFGMVVFESDAYLAKPLGLVGETDMEKIKSHILEIRERGSTQMSAGMKMGSELFDDYLDVDPDEYENRIIFLTDAQPNMGELSEEGLLGMTQKYAEKRIYTTFIGMGLDFNTELIEYITKIRGANYYSVHSSKQFKTRMDDEFEYMVTPLVFNLELRLDADGYEIQKVYGSPEADEATGEIMKVNTLFPSKKEEGETKGGIIILKLRKTAEDGSLKLSASYEDRAGNEDKDEKKIDFGDESSDYYQNNGIRKGILLSRYADLMKGWIMDEREDYDEPIIIEPYVTREVGIICPPPWPPEHPQLSRWERQSVSLKVSSHYSELFSDFADYFESEMEAIGDETLEKELELLEKLKDY